MKLYRFILIICAANYPILHFYVPNKDFILEGGIGVASLVVSIISFLIFIGFNFLTKKPNNSALIAMILIVSFQIYGHLYYGLMDGLDIGYENFKHRYYFPLYCLFTCMPIYFLVKKEGVTNPIVKVFCVIFIFLCLQYLYPLVVKINLDENKNKGLVSVTKKLQTPNIYYIILDSYPNNKNLESFYDFDNSIFTDGLERKGFKVISNARSNYPYTYFSLSSSLNMCYINNFEDSVRLDKYEDDFPFKKIHKNKVVDYLRERGYRYVLSKSAYGQLNSEYNSDVFIDNSTVFNSFHQEVLNLSLLSAFDIGKIYHNKIYEVTKKAFNNWRKILDVKGSKFVFFHSLAPHPPMVFNEDGSFNGTNQIVKNRYKLKTAYVSQIKYINRTIKNTVELILQKEKENAIIIIQGDHGTCSVSEFEDELKWPKYLSDSMKIERYGILNAIYIPMNIRLNFDSLHTPVNTFPKILNAVFNDSLDVLENHFYFGRYRPPYNFYELKTN